MPRHTYIVRAHSLALQLAIVELVIDESDEPPTDEETAARVDALACKHGLSDTERATLAEIAKGPIGY